MSWTLPRVVGIGRARRILLTDQVLDTDTALAAGPEGAEGLAAFAEKRPPRLH